VTPFWLSFAVASAIGCWVAYAWFAAALLWALVATALALGLFVVGLLILPNYVRIRADHYAESFLSATLELDRTKPGRKPKADDKEVGQ
jgi:hypothetical protein